MSNDEIKFHLQNDNAAHNKLPCRLLWSEIMEPGRMTFDPTLFDRLTLCKANNLPVFSELCLVA